ncbi:MAG: N-acetyltransferase [Ktedonobacterales bacterium]|nr:N-acetyltransferase [Ktedonobacterales bacterium]
MEPFIRLATEADASACQAIYAPIVRESATSFEIDPPTVAEMAQRITKTLTRWPWLVCEQSAEVVGYAYASPHRERAAYQWAVDVSVYVHDQRRGQGIGRALYTALFAALRAQGYYHVLAGIALPNPGSVALHEAMGLVPLGVYRQVGYKLGAWHDVGWWQGALQPLPAHPQPPLALATLQQHATWDALGLR